MQFVHSEPTIFRPRISVHIGNIFDDETIGKNVEKSIFNYAIKEAQYRQIIKKWKNIKFAKIYAVRLRTLLHNFKINPEIISLIKSNSITPAGLANITHQELCPDHWKVRIENKIKRDNSKMSTNIEASTDLFTCKKCKSKKCTYYELQTRSADEPATIFITCLDCGKNWKN
jgi:DNA-directed RNA polymerase subunit M/transcription elongation factor TFIIS